MYDVWKNALAEIEQKISPANFSTWFQDTSLISTKNGNVRIGVKNTFFVKQLRNRYLDIIKTALENNNVVINTIDFEVQTSSKVKPRSREITKTDIDLKSHVKNYAKTLKTESSRQTGLNKKYTLDSFVVGSNNDLAVSVAKSIIDSPGSRYNPFFLYGGPGLGKTHLVQAIGNELLRRNPNFKIFYTPIAHFYSDFIDAIQNGKGREFSRKFEKLDCLIIDDFQFIVGKEKSQEEFFNIFNDLYQLNKQIIVTSDRLPSQIKTVDERLATRLTWAGAFDLQLPKFEDKCAILKAKAELMGAEIEDEAIEYLAENVNTNIRDLEGELSSLLVMSEVRGLTPLELIENGSIYVNKTSKLRPTSPKQVVEKVAKFYNLPVKEMCGKSRVAHIKNARQVAMFLLSKELSLSTNKIASEVGVKDHTTVMHGIKKIEKDLKLNFTLRDEIESIKEKIYG
ncbi:chromosomal replication initiator protein DnaA [Candidatus Saccharibacteria bacterium]|nr:chromosomal replication initiator protein DnaA [Candidatus Saccharibacteria bacterium]MBR3132436.1 chromosomal replication initiator protein DnaA [Candidatus Saccharibacteria bacterium]